MALSAKLAMRQGQSMVLTPQLLQAIKLLQMPNSELAAFIESELERNPLLDRADDRTPAESAHEGDEPAPPAEIPVSGDWSTQTLETDAGALARNLGTEIDNAFGPDRAATPAERPPSDEGQGLSATSWTGVNGRGADGSAPDIEAYLTATESLGEYLTRQAMIVLADPGDRLVAQSLIDGIDEAGYFTGTFEDIAMRLGATLAHVEAVHARLLTLEPTGVFARDLAECLALQLIERDRYDPAMRALIANLPALAKRDMALLRKVCGVDDDDLSDMIGEIKRLDPKPGRGFGAGTEPTAIPDVYVTTAPDSSWRVELNSDALPRVLVKGVSGLRPLNLKAVADAIGVHESTVSRATSNKFMQTPRGLFEMKYFFTTSIASNGAGEAHSAESVRHKIKQMIDAEDPRDVLSDDVIVARLRQADIVVARRTVAKYRDNLRIPSSVDRRRLKMTPARGSLGASDRLNI
jgi:RNA polymerase sigma-54 factor